MNNSSLTPKYPHPVNLISNEMQEISSGAGDLTRQLQFRSKDEIGILTQNFNKFVSDIRNIVISIASSSSVLNESLDSISFISEELAKSTEMIAVSVQGVSSGSDEQSAMVKNLKDFIDTMSCLKNLMTLY
ncbi:methyl-accepting chemotaxis protein [Petroclostridium sp. X23]|uniref:HAMP domain-containing protein n=1 Tax=Petroclostridium sp. X23 TaxID=3045146 RepID=UPI0024AC9AEC|nr:methyl-accepting chemotaxis protein [Petroclostridium sp. X23]WHH61173.1 methyl-accepting chemotaxis protein [Petroclostridium sp. X23]